MGFGGLIEDEVADGRVLADCEARPLLRVLRIRRGLGYWLVRMGRSTTSGASCASRWRIGGAFEVFA